MKKRKDCFFGLHFDYHANDQTKNIGIDFKDEVLDEICEKVKPDFIQCDTKGHPGYTSYKTKYGNSAPGIVNDLLRNWRRVTAKHDIALYSHYSGIWDMKQAKDHPDWAATWGDGSPSDRISIFSPYVNEICIPQLIELGKELGINGAWVDGECWAQTEDKCEYAKIAFKNETGKELDEVSHEEQLAFWRKSFLNYVKYYITEIKKELPDFEITSNWLNSVFIPDDVNITDYISGDLSPTNSVDSARFDGRLLAASDRNWDIMSWGISYPIHYAKSAVQLCQEAAEIISLGGGYQIYNMQSPQEVCMDKWAIPFWAECAKFIRDRQPYCQYSSLIPDIGIIYSKDAYYASIESLYSNCCEYSREASGLLDATLDAGRNVSIILEERLRKKNINDYSAIVLTDGPVFNNDTKHIVLEYAKNGGTVLLSGARTVEAFKDELELEIASPVCPHPVAFLTSSKYKIEVRKPYYVIKAKNLETNIVLHECMLEGDLNFNNPPPSVREINEDHVAVGTIKYGKGKIVLLPITLGKVYFDDLNFEYKRFFEDVYDVVGKSKITHNKHAIIDIALMGKEDKVYISLTNMLGDHRSNRIKTFDYIPPVHNVEVKYICERPSKVYLPLKNKEISFNYENGTLTFVVDEVAINEIVEIIK